MTTQENMLARHRILHELGRGAVGAVYAARDRTTGVVVALKRLDPELLKSDASFHGRFLKHARSARHLTHRNIVRIHDAGEAAGTAYVAMEMLEGENLRNILDHGPLPIARAIQIAHEIACGLAYAHLEGVIHGGVKPSNIIVLRSGVVKITDFGIGPLGQAALLSGARAGCLSYLSPEQVRGDPVDHRCDIFSLGALFYEMLTRRRPFEGDSPNEIMENILHAEPPPPSGLNPLVPHALDAIVLSMLARQPAARMPGVPVLLRELQRLEEGLGLESGASAGPEEPAASVPPVEPAPGLRAASVPPVEPEPGLRTPDPNRFEDRAPMQDGPRFARPGEFRDASVPGIRPDSSAADEFRHRQITDREFLEYARAMRARESGPQRSSRSRPAIFAALALVLAVLGIGLTDFMGVTSLGVTGFLDEWSGRIERGIAASRMQQAPATAGATRPTRPSPVAEAPKEPVTAPPAPQASPPPSAGDGKAEQAPSGIASASAPEVARPTAPSPVVEATRESLTAPAAPQAPQASPPPAVSGGKVQQPSPGIAAAPDPKPAKPIAAEPGALALLESLIANAPEQPKSARAAPAKQFPRALQSTAKVPAQQPGSPARLILDVSPGGELYIDGEHHGTTPPITTLALEPGMHRIEVRSGSRKPYLTYMTVEPGDVRRIQHDFDAKWSRPPR